MTTQHIQSVVFAAPAYVATIGRVTEKTKPFPNGDTRESVPVEIDLASLPVESIDFALRYGLGQYIADGAAGAEDLAGYKLGIAQRIEKLVNADFTRTRGEGVAKPDSETGRALKLARAFLAKMAKDAGIKADPAALKEAATALVANDPKWIKEAKAQLKAEAAMQTEDGNDAVASAFALLMAGVKTAPVEGDDEAAE